MEIEKRTKTIRFESEVVTDEATLSSKADTRVFYSHQVTPIRQKPSLSLRVRKFLIRQKTRRPMELGIHQKGVHWMGDAILHSESGCLNCKIDLDKGD